MQQSCKEECGAFWTHISQAGLIKETFVSLDSNANSACGGGFPTGEGASGCTNFTQQNYMPRSQYHGFYWGVGSLDNSYPMSLMAGLDLSSNVFYLGLRQAGNGNYLPFQESLSVSDANSIDIKIDDGKPHSGKFLVSSWYYIPGSAWWNGSTSPGWNNTGVYSTNTQDTASCFAMFVW